MKPLWGKLKLNNQKKLKDNQPIMFRKRGYDLLLILLVTFAAFALRSHALEYQSMWSDEGLTLYRARQPISTILANTITVDGVDTHDTNPAFYFLLLHVWRSVAGESVFVLRYFNAALATLSIPLIYLLTTAVFKRKAGLVTAVFLTLSPLHIWNAQILRNYGLLLTLNLLSVYGLVRFLQASPSKNRWLWFGVWAGAGLVGIFTHYFGFFVLALGVLILLLQILSHWWQPTHGTAFRPGRWFWLAAIVWGLLLIPLVLTAFDRFQIGQQIDFYNTPPIDFFTHAIHAFSAGDIRGITHPWWRVWPAALLALLGILFGWRSHRAGTLLILGYQLVPLGILIFLSAITPLYNGTRHLLIALPPFLIFCGMGMVGGWIIQKPTHKTRYDIDLFLKYLGLILGLLLLFIQGQRVYVQFTDPDYLRDDVRGAAQYLSQHAQPQDIIILHDTLIGFTFDYYYDGVAPWQAIPLFHQQDLDQATAKFEEAGRHGGRIWFLSQPTPRTGFPREHLIEWADAHWIHLFTKSFPSFWLGTELRAYLATPMVPDIGEDSTAITAVYPHLQLHGINHPAVLQAGQPWWLTLYWSASASDSADYHLSVRLSDADGQLWQQADIPLWNDTTTPYRNSLLLRTDHEITLPAGMPSGSYTMTLRLLDKNLELIATSDNIIDFPVSQVSVNSSKNPDDLPPITQQKERLGPLNLHGFTLPSGNIKPGHVVPLTLYWQVRQPPQTDLQLQFVLLDNDQNPVWGQNQPLAQDISPSSTWQADEVLKTTANFIMPATAVTKPYTIRLTLTDPTGKPVSKTIELDKTVMVEEWPLETIQPTIPTPIDAILGKPPLIRLSGIDLSETTVQPNSILPLTFFWQAIEAPEDNFAVFIHLVDAEQNIVSQQDSMPVNGLRPTASWRPDEVVVDSQHLFLSPDLSPGNYQLYAGLYNPYTELRLLPQINGETLSDGRILLGTITVEAGE
ncbi:MAG: hypothetical protein CSA11_02815 [Chloroflexi bacterium]|nr:MAG: hypothetical protein CSA11_02815 [Chloroflexota bacterium]